MFSVSDQIQNISPQRLFHLCFIAVQGKMQLKIKKQQIYIQKAYCIFTGRFLRLHNLRPCLHYHVHLKTFTVFTDGSSKKLVVLKCVSCWDCHLKALTAWLVSTSFFQIQPTKLCKEIQSHWDWDATVVGDFQAKGMKMSSTLKHGHI